MNTPLKTSNVGSVTVKIMFDDHGDHECPLEYTKEDDGVIFVSFEKRSTLSDYHKFSSPEEAKTWGEENDYDVLPLFKYEHSGVAYSPRSFIGRAHHAEWDSGQVGFVLVKLDKFKDSTPLQVAESWCKSVTTWVNNEYYGYVIENPDGEHLDSCWGFDDMDYCEQEALSAANYHNETELEKV